MSRQVEYGTKYTEASSNIEFRENAWKIWVSPHTCCFSSIQLKFTFETSLTAIRFSLSLSGYSAASRIKRTIPRRCGNGRGGFNASVRGGVRQGGLQGRVQPKPEPGRTAIAAEGQRFTEFPHGQFIPAASQNQQRRWVTNISCFLLLKFVRG